MQLTHPLSIRGVFACAIYMFCAGFEICFTLYGVALPDIASHRGMIVTIITVRGLSAGRLRIQLSLLSRQLSLCASRKDGRYTEVEFGCRLITVLISIAVTGCMVPSKRYHSAQTQQQMKVDQANPSEITVKSSTKSDEPEETDSVIHSSHSVDSQVSHSRVEQIAGSQPNEPLMPSDVDQNGRGELKTLSYQKEEKLDLNFPEAITTEPPEEPPVLFKNEDEQAGDENNQQEWVDHHDGHIDGNHDDLYESIPLPDSESGAVLRLEDVLNSVYESYPLLQSALLSRSVADGELLSTQGAFDLKLKGGGTSGPLGFYKTNRYGVGASQPLFSGGEIFWGYKVGHGNFQPWFKERQTDNGGEFSAGISVPLSQNRQIDKRRAAQYRATFGREAVEPEIQTQIISFVWDSTYAYWTWVAAGQNYKIAQRLLEIAQQRNEGLKRRVEQGDLSAIELTDNARLIVSRETALIDARRKLQQSAIKLSLFLRTPDGRCIVPTEDQLPDLFPEANSLDPAQMENDIDLAMSNRPELASLELLRKQYEVDLAQARNMYLPSVDASLFASKDVGAASSAKRDKTPFELEASLQVSVPLQRRKAIGKIQAIEAKLARLSVKMDFTRDKIATDVQNVYAAQLAAFNRIERAKENLELARTMEQAERRKFELGESNLLLVNLREVATAKAAKELLQSQLDYFKARADYHAALAFSDTPESTP